MITGTTRYKVVFLEGSSVVGVKVSCDRVQGTFDSMTSMSDDRESRSTIASVKEGYPQDKM